MSYKLILAEEAERDLLLWKKSGQKKDQLKGNLSGYWSRRINKHFRTIYAIHEDIVTVEVISARKHYDNK